MNKATFARRFPGTLAMFLLVTTAAASDWERVYDREDLRVDRRDYRGSELDEIRGVVRLRASLNAVMALLRDADFNRQWVYRSSGARILESIGYSQAYVYGVVDAPFPMSDRDTVVRFDYQQNAVTQEIIVKIENFPEFIAPQPGLVRVPEIGGFWKLQAQEGGWVEVTYQVYGDPGGWIPAWLANRAAQLSVVKTLENMQAVVGRYEGSASEYVRESMSTQ